MRLEELYVYRDEWRLKTRGERLGIGRRRRRRLGEWREDERREMSAEVN